MLRRVNGIDDSRRDGGGHIKAKAIGFNWGKVLLFDHWVQARGK